jgi:hypothetical protein
VPTGLEAVADDVAVAAMACAIGGERRPADPLVCAVGDRAGDDEAIDDRGSGRDVPVRARLPAGAGVDGVGRTEADAGRELVRPGLPARELNQAVPPQPVSSISVIQRTDGLQSLVYRRREEG